jgi:ABC-type glycerol-3-phosphate transport system substrate-binding protein
MKQHRLSLHLPLLLGLTFSLAACGATPATSGSTSVAPSGDTIKITFWQVNGATLLSAFQDAGKAFAALAKTNDNVNLDIEVTYEGGYSDVRSKVLNGFAVGNVPTIAIAYPDSVADFIAADTDKKGYVVNLGDYVEDEKIGFGKEAWIGDGPISDLVPAFYQEGSHYAQSGLYSLPFMKSSEVLFYNYDLAVYYGKTFTPSGTTAPLSTASAVKNFMANCTWSQLLEFAQHIKNASGTKFTAPIWYDADENLYISQSYQRDIPYISETSAGKLSADFVNDDAKAMVKEWKDAYDKGLLVTKGTQGTYGSTAFKEEKCVFTIGSTGGTGYSDSSSFQAEAVKVPYSNGKPLYVSQGPTFTVLNSTGLSAEANALAAKYAFKFIKYLTSAKINSVLCANNSEGYCPVRISGYETDAYQTYIEENAENLLGKAAKIVTTELPDKYFYTPAIKGSATARTSVGGIVSQVLLGKQTIDAAFTSAYAQTMKAA